MTHREVRALIAFCVTALPGLTVPPEPHLSRMVAVWTDLLGDVPADLAQAAVRRVLMEQTGAWWPTPGAIRAAAAQLTASHQPSVEAAWAQVQAAVRRYGYYQPDAALAHLDPPVRAVVEALGWEAICLGDPDVLRGQFTRYYTAHITAADRTRRLPRDLRDGALAGGTPEGDRAPRALGDVLRVALDREGAL